MIKDISNQRFGRLVALERTGEMRWGVSLWRCLCDCGSEKVAAVNSLKSGTVQSCGCLLKETAAASMKTHGMYGTPTYTSWDSMVQRCKNPKHASYERYGGAGIDVCERWLKFENFYADMGERPAGTSLDRIDGAKGYWPENCRWADAFEQARNRRVAKLTPELAERIRAMFLLGAYPSRIAKELGVSKSSVSTIVYTSDYWAV